MKLRSALAAAAMLGATVAPVVVAAPAQAAWTCSDGACHAVSHRSPDDGYNDPILVKCGNNLVQYSLGIGQNSQAVGCNDVNQWYVRAGHSINCNINGTWTEMAENGSGSGFWTSSWLFSSYAGTTYICVDAWYGTIGGGSGGGGGGGGTWRQVSGGGGGDGGGGTW